MEIVPSELASPQLNTLPLRIQRGKHCTGQVAFHPSTVVPPYASEICFAPVKYALHFTGQAFHGVNGAGRAGGVKIKGVILYDDTSSNKNQETSKETIGG